MNHSRYLRSMFVLGTLLILNTHVSHAQDGMRGKLGLGGFGGAGIPLGTEALRDRGDAGQYTGGTVRFGMTHNWAVGASYDNIYLQNGIRREPITLSGVYYHHPDKNWTPVGEFGVGVASTNPGETFENFSVKAGIGAEFFLTKSKCFAIGPQLNFHFISTTGDAPFNSYIMTPGLIAMLYFGGSDAAPSPQASTLAPMVATFAVLPNLATLGPNQSRQFEAQMGERSNALVHWTIEPPLGSISDNGNYQAPSTISFAEQVQITATSAADPGKKATAVVQLTPPAAAPKQVTLRLEVLFATGKATINPAYQAEFKKTADFLKSYPHTTAAIEGHTDNTGSAAINRKISQRRADAVRQYLITNYGIQAARLTATGYGSDKPIADNNTAHGRGLNRRVIAVIKATVQ